MQKLDPTVGHFASAFGASVSYLDIDAARIICQNASDLLGAVGFGIERPDFLPSACAFIAAPLQPVGSGAIVELWRTGSPCRATNIGPVTGACSENLAFGAITLEEMPGVCLEDTVEAAYLAIFNFLDSSAFHAPLRFWNYLSNIIQEESGLERYRRFNIGRHRAFSARLQEPLPPAASGVGGTGGASTIYFLAARTPARPIENPRQVSAFTYPPLYGPRSPSFSRASIYHADGKAFMFISGTASIVGHESRHEDDLKSQTAETITNLRAVIGASGVNGLNDWTFKIYLRDPTYRHAVEHALIEAFGSHTQRLYLQGEICRQELMIEIEAFCCSSQ